MGICLKISVIHKIMAIIYGYQALYKYLTSYRVTSHPSLRISQL